MSFLEKYIYTYYAQHWAAAGPNRCCELAVLLIGLIRCRQ